MHEMNIALEALLPYMSPFSSKIVTIYQKCELCILRTVINVSNVEMKCPPGQHVRALHRGRQQLP